MGSLPRNSESTFAALQSLDYDWLSCEPQALLENMRTCSAQLKGLSIDLSLDEISQIYEEFCLHDNPPKLMLAVFTWIHASCHNILGRREARHSIIDYFRSVRTANEVDNAVQDKFISFHSSPLAANGSHTPKSERGSDRHMADDLKYATKRASLLLKGNTLIFDGVNSPNMYSIFRFELQELIVSSGSAPGSLVAFECIMGALRNPALQSARQYIGSQDLYHAEDPADKLWTFLDSQFLTPDSVRHIAELYNGCKQKPQESIPSFLARFQRIAAVMRSNQNIDDSGLIIKLSSSVVSAEGTMAIGILDSMGITSFNAYCIHLVNISRNMAKITGHISTVSEPRNVENNITQTRKICLRCSDNGHVIDDCPRVVKFACRHCGSMEHYHQACPQAPAPRRDNRKKQSVKSSIAAELRDTEIGVSIPNNVARPSLPRVRMNAIGVCDPRLIDSQEVTIDILINTTSTGQLRQSCLVDTGAGANFISFELAQQLIKSGAINRSDVRSLTSAITITYGNKTTEKADCYVPLRVSREHCEIEQEILLIVTKSSAYPLVLGRTGIRQLSPNSVNVPCLNSRVTLDAPPSRKPLVTVTQFNRIQVHHAVLEAASVLPFRAQRRSRSHTDLALIHAVLERMEEQGKVSRCSSRDAHVVHEVVLVDKQSHLKIPRTLPTGPDSLSRYRITLDMRNANELELVDVGPNSKMLCPTGGPSKTQFDQQAQSSSFDILQHLPADLSWFAKIDLSDAYSSVLISEDIRGLFCYGCPHPTTGVLTYYRWNCLVQGWKYSPLLFSVAIEFVLEICRSSIQSPVHFRHYQDDILIAGHTKEQVSAGMSDLMKIFTRHGFNVNPDKTYFGQSPTFCGYLITSSGIIPHPKNPISHHFVEYSWSLFMNAKSETRLTLLRQWAGKINYYLGFLPPSMLCDLRTIYKSISLLMKGSDLDSDLGKIHAAFTSICCHILDGNIGSFPCGKIPNTEYSVIFADANVESYSGMLCRLCVSATKCTTSPDISALISALNLPQANYSLVPVRFTGGVFSVSEQKQSSTYRERVAQLNCLNDFYPLLYGKVAMVSDNQNVSKNWHHLEECLSYGSNLIPWLRFVSSVHCTIWIPRNNPLISFVDLLARAIAHRPTTVTLATAIASAGVNTTAPCAAAPTAPCDAAPPTDLPSGDTIVAPADAGTSPVPRPLILPIRSSLQDAYLTDTTLYKNVPLVDIYNHLVHAIELSGLALRLASRFVYEYGVLWHIRVHGTPQVYVPAGGDLSLHENFSGSIRANILFHFHDTPLGLHRGYKKLVTEIANHFWWPSILKDCLHYVESCEKCSLNKLRFSRFKGELRGIPADFPFSTWIVDHAGPINGEYILVAVCAFSSWALLIRVPDTSAVTTAKSIFTNIVCTYGLPLSIHSDRGSAFNNQIMQDLCDRLSIKWGLSASYSPRTQGQAERLVQHMKICLSILDFDLEQLALIQLYHNTSVIGDSPFTPHEIIFGVKANITPLLNLSLPTDFDSDFSRMVMETRITWQQFKALLRDRQADVYASKSLSIDFTSGDKVYRVYIGSLKKTMRTGPHTVIAKKEHTNMYLIEGFDYPIPDYQLHPFTGRSSDLALVPLDNFGRKTATPDASQTSKLQQGNLVVFENYDDYSGEVTCYDVGEFINQSDGRIILNRFWFKGDGTWERWDDEFVTIEPNQIVIPSVHLTPSGKLPRGVVSRLLR